MQKDDTVSLLDECSAGIKMGVNSIEEVLDKVKNTEFKERLTECMHDHEKLNSELSQLLSEYGSNGKEPNPIAKSMSWLKTNVKLSYETADEIISDLITDGCNMGVKSLNRYLNKYSGADKRAKSITEKLIKSEEDLAVSIRKYL